jgi:hypothetical protein
LISLPVLQTANATTATATNAASATQQVQAVNLPQLNFSSGATTVLTSNAAANNRVAQAAQNANNNVTTPIKTLLEEDDKDDMDDGPTIANIPTTNMTTHVVGHATTVDGVNLDEIREFAKAFKLRRLALGLTQTQVGQALSATKGPAYSQSAICRFEKLDITPKSAAKIKPVLEKWMQEAELKYADRLKTGSHQNFADLLGTENTKKRKRRTSFTPQALEILNEYFEKNTHPSDGNQGADMTMLANKLNYDREVIRVWFCNKRQALKNTLKKMKTGDGNGVGDQSDVSLSPNSSQLNTSTTTATVVTTTQQAQVVNANNSQLTQLANQLTNTPTKTVITLTNSTTSPSNEQQSVSAAQSQSESTVVEETTTVVVSLNSASAAASSSATATSTSNGSNQADSTTTQSNNTSDQADNSTTNNNSSSNSNNNSNQNGTNETA